MAIPQSFLDELKSRVSIVEVVGRRLTFDQRKSLPARGDYWACCPFHGERTASFHVREDRGYFHCFGCGEKGSALDFVMKLDNLSFREAVEELASIAGMTVPAEDPRTARREARRAELTEVTAAAAQVFHEALFAPEGAHALAYLESRGVTRESIARFRLGYAPDSRDALLKRLRAMGAAEDQMVEVDVATRPDNGGAPYARFRDRLMFPIEDVRGRVIAFGGRALSADAQAKYLNSRETSLFSKGKVLYNFRAARSASKDAPLIVVEGYMDVIALAQAGFEAAVAPLGTAMTEDQLALLWKASMEPVMALDGDEAGLRAARKAADLALERLTPGRSLQFALLPGGQDPDDLIKSGGAAAMQAALDAALPLIELIWAREVEAGPLDTPERRAALDARIEALIERIADPSVRRHYHYALKDRRFQLFRSSGGRDGAARRNGGRQTGRHGGQGGKKGGWRGQGRPYEAGPTAEALANPLARAGAAPRDGGEGAAEGGGALGALFGDERLSQLTPEHARRLRQRIDTLHHNESMLLAAALRHPWLVERHQPQLDALEFFDTRLDSVRNAILSALIEVEQADGETSPERFREMVDARVGAAVLAALESEGAKRLPKPLTNFAQTKDAEASFVSLIETHGLITARILEGRDYAADMATLSEEERLWRLNEVVGKGDLGRSAGGGERGNDDESELSRRLASMARRAAGESDEAGGASGAEGGDEP